MKHQRETYELQVGDRGRVVLPAKLRHKLALRKGDRMVARLEANSVIRVEALAKSVRSFRGAYRDAATGRDLVGELLEERRREAEQEGGRRAAKRS
ncbi:MAG: AbrB/MazE/SpoVT family DNA-binding domain-containing protein [Actinomycetota bacterium]